MQPFVEKAIQSKAALPFIVVYCPGLCGKISGGATSIHCAFMASDRHSDHKV